MSPSFPTRPAAPSVGPSGPSCTGWEVIEITPRTGGEKVPTGHTAEAVMPHDYGHALAVWHKAGD